MNQSSPLPLSKISQRPRGRRADRPKPKKKRPVPTKAPGITKNDPMTKLPEPATLASTESRGYIQEPKTLDEFEHNARFQMDNVKGYLMMDADGLPSALNAARIKSGCLIQDAYALERALVAEFNQREASAIALLDKMKGGVK